MNKETFNKKTLCKALFLVLGLLLIVAMALFVKMALQGKETKGLDESGASDLSEQGIFYNGKQYLERPGISTWLFFGLDQTKAEIEADQDNANSQADFLIVFVFDDMNKTYKAIHINRDTMVKIDLLSMDGSQNLGSQMTQITLAHAQGDEPVEGARNLKNAISELLYGIPIKHYVSFTLDVIPVLNDLVGGVSVEMLEDFSHIDPSMTKGSTVRLVGSNAQAYVQGRMAIGDGTNEGRMERQAQYMTALEKAIRDKRSADDDFYMEMVTTLSEYIESDSGIKGLDVAMDKYSSYENLGTLTIAGESVMGAEHMEFYADDTALQQMVIELFYEPAK